MTSIAQELRAKEQAAMPQRAADFKLVMEAGDKEQNPKARKALRLLALDTLLGLKR
jgi:hypothetical protein